MFIFIKDWKKEIFTIPNLLSLLRLLLIPIYVIIYLQAQEPADYFLSGAILAVSCLTDLVDGKIARHFNMITTVGKVLDPLADKATQFTLIVCLAIKHNILWYLVGLFFLKEIFQLVAGCLNLRKGRMLKGALFSGKICTTVLFITLTLMILVPTLSETAITVIAIIDGLFLLAAFADYAFTYYARPDKFQTIDMNNHKNPEV